MNAPAQRLRFRIAANHPALPGHFPGRPVVPGVVLLERVAALVEQVHGVALAGLPQVKFVRPLLPEQDAELMIEDDGQRVRFRIVLADAGHDAPLIASGSVELMR